LEASGIPVVDGRDNNVIKHVDDEMARDYCFAEENASV